MTVQPLIGRPPFAPTGKLKLSYNSQRSGLQGNANPPTGKEAHSGRPLSPVSRKKSRVSRPRSSGKSFHFPRRTFSSPPTGCPSRRFAASATPAFGDRSPFLCRRANFLCRRSTFLCRRRPHAARPQHPPSRAYRHSNPPDLPSVLRQSAVHRLAIPCPPVRTSDRRVRPYCRSRLVVPAISFTSTTHLVSLFREAFTGCLCRIPPRTV